MMAIDTLFSALDLGKLKEFHSGISNLIKSLEEVEPEKLRSIQDSDLQLLLKNSPPESDRSKKIQKEIDYRRDNNLTMEILEIDNYKVRSWSAVGQDCRKDGPQEILTFKDGTIVERWKIVPHKYCNRPEQDGPACIEYWPSGQMKKCYWQPDGKFSRKEGPAIICVDEKARVTNEKFYSNDIMTKETHYYY